MGEVAGMAPRLLGLCFAMGEKLVDLFGQRADFGGKFVADPGLIARTDRGDLVAHAPQRPEAI